MERFNVSSLVGYSNTLGRLITSPRKDSEALGDKGKNLAKVMPALQEALTGLGLKASAITVGKIAEQSQAPTATVGVLRVLAKELQGRIEDELRGTVFLHVSMKQAQYYQSPLEGLDEVVKKFRSTTFDLEEASKCLALNRYTAAVFHSMRVMEVALHALGAKLSLSASTNRSWDAILGKCHTEETAKKYEDRSPEWNADAEFLSGAAAMLRSVKNAWRNPTMHVEAKYTEEEAEDILNHVKAFMRHLATKLSEEVPS